ncbi:MAG TPA: Ig-like domain-containing protein [Gemmatimonadaceae bacterium]
MRIPFDSSSRRALLSAAIGLLAAACNGDSSSPPRVAKVTIEPASTTRVTGETVQFIATAADASGNPITGRTVTWESSNIAVATISTTGLATTVGEGTTTITATIDGVEDVATLNVVPGVASVTITPERDTIGVGKSVQLGVVILDQMGGTVTDRTPTWTTNPPGVVSVSATGVVTGIAEGIATVTATIDGKTDAAVIQVEDPCSTLLSQPITLGATVNGQLESNDCQLNDGTFIDAYLLVLGADTDVQIDMSSTAFDTYLIVLEETPTGFLDLGQNDDVDQDNCDPFDADIEPACNSRLVVSLEAGKIYHILANSALDNEFGAYTLTVAQSSIVAGVQADTPMVLRKVKGRAKPPISELWPRR